ncbi:hypothetical protein KCP69_08170 [Salmonella enterica subsp. enterica]|nr:hypothetical protein KCP69_08170 [Salmonella enterica subsp. enterica]
MRQLSRHFLHSSVYPLARGTRSSPFSRSNTGLFAGAGNTHQFCVSPVLRFIRWRGEPPLPVVVVTRARSLSAGANTFVINCHVSSSSVYPRRRGEHKFGTGSTLRERGLSSLACKHLRVNSTAAYHRGVLSSLANTGGGVSAASGDRPTPLARGHHRRSAAFVT